jgi:hypothetical protein
LPPPPQTQFGPPTAEPEEVGVAFWVSPRDAVFAIAMTQAPDHYLYFRQVFRNMVNAAIL